MAQEQIGFIIMSNCSGNWINSVVTNELMAGQLGNEEYFENASWYHNNCARLDSFIIANHQKFLDAQKKGTKPSLELKEYCGTYNDVMYGDVIVDTLALQHFQVGRKRPENQRCTDYF